MITAVILFSVAAVGGSVMAAMCLLGKDRPPTAHALVHGLVAAAGLVTLIISVDWSVAPPMAMLVLAGFVIATLGGLNLFFVYHMKQRPLPILLMSLHAAVAMTSYSPFTSLQFVSVSGNIMK